MLLKVVLCLFLFAPAGVGNLRPQGEIPPGALFCRERSGSEE